MTILFAGGENSEVDILNGAMITTAGTFRSTYARGAIRSSANDAGVIHTYSGELAAYITAQGTATDFWYGFQYVGAGGALLGSSCVTFYGGTAHVPFFQIGNFTGSIGTCYPRTSPDGFTSTITTYTSATIPQPTTPTEWTFRIKRDASAGLLQWWIAGALWWQFQGDTASLFSNGVTRTGWGIGGTNTTQAVSEIVATSSDDPRVGMNCFTLYYTGNGANTDWTGTYTDVAELSEDTATVLTTGSASKDSSFTHVSLPTLSTGNVIRAVIPSGKWRTATGAPANLYGYLRISGTNYANAPLPASMQAVAAVAGLLQFIWHLSPATGLAFTEAEVNALEPGMRSAA